MTTATSVFPAQQSTKSKFYSLIFLLIIAVPITILIFLFLQGPLLFTISMSALLLAVLGMLAYFAVAGAKTSNYEIVPNSMRANFGLLKKTVPFDRIAKAEVANFNVLLRLFGASLPGFHWGLFRTSIGNLHLYATKISGDFLVLTLTDGEKYAFSPQDPQGMLVAIERNRGQSIQKNPLEIKRQENSLKRLVYLQVAVVSLVYTAFLGYFFWVYVSLPQIVPLHFGFDGVPNRFGDKSELLWLAGLTAALPLINAVLTLKFGKHERGFVLLLGTIFVVVSAVFFFVTYNIVSLMA